MNSHLHPKFRDTLNSFARAQTAYDREIPEDNRTDAEIEEDAGYWKAKRKQWAEEKRLEAVTKSEISPNTRIIK